MNKKTGVIKYTETAFEQDAGQAMKNDVVRALIELITNCDDAYARAGKTGTIEIVVRRPAASFDPIEISVRDRATGLNPQRMEDNFVVLGGDRSGFAEGKEVRGLFSRGSKDTAWFGETVFESIKDDTYSRLSLDNKGKWESSHEDATLKHRTSLGLEDEENGLSATMVITRRDTRVPSLNDLVRRLGSHVQLRQVVQTQDVTIAEYRAGKLIQAPTVVWEVPKSTVLFDGQVEVKGYECSAHLVINKLAERSDGPVTEDSVHGIEVRGSRAAYMNTMFGQAGPGSAFINGVVTCSKIDSLIREFGASNSADPKNPMRLVSRSRDGLESTHPFMQALTIAVVEKLKPFLDELESKPTEAGSPELRKDLDKFARLLAEEMKSDLDEDDDEGMGGNLPTPLNPIIVIPRVARLKLGSRGTLTVLVLEGSAGQDGLNAAVSSDVCKVIGVSPVLQKHVTFEGVLVGQVKIDTVSLGSATVVISAVSKPTDAGAAEVVIHDVEGEETEPTTLEWKNPTMSVIVGKTRTVRLRAPLSLAPAGELTAIIELSGLNIRLEDNDVTLQLISKGWLEARVKVTGLIHGPEAWKIVAHAAGKSADGVIRTTIPSPLGGLNIIPDLRDEFAGPMRGQLVVENDCLKLVMYGRHRALASRLGSRRSDGSYTRDTELDALVVIAEVMASVAGDHILMLKVKRDPVIYQDIDKVMYERTKLVDRYLRIMLEGINVSTR